MPKDVSVCVFCGSMPGVRPVYAEAARRVGRALARRGLGVVYGGGHVGLMGIVADAALAAGGQVIGVIPEPLALKEVAHEGLTRLEVVPGMHERKARMASLSSAFLTLPGGIGTLEEFFEVLSWAALGLHAKPVGLLNVDGYYDPLLRLLEHAATEGFIRPEHRRMIVVSTDPEAVPQELLSFVPPPPGPKWIGQEEA